MIHERKHAIMNNSTSLQSYSKLVQLNPLITSTENFSLTLMAQAILNESDLKLQAEKPESTEIVCNNTIHR